jgi:glycosyltransferase involved in cell wall biosynthesis
MLTAPRILIISPVRNEAVHIERVVRAVAAQELPPARWIVIDDRSVDGTLDLLRVLEPEVPFMEVYEAGPAPHAGARDRLARAAAPRNFNAGLAHADWREYTHVMKLDGDIEMPSDYLRVVCERFAADPEVGLAGGTLVEPQLDGPPQKLMVPIHHVHGALKLYSRECFEAIGGVQERLAWDTIDETYARMRGYSTLRLPDLISVHHRPWGTADGAIRGRARLGECAYITHYPLSWVLLRAVKLALGTPKGKLGAAYLFGYIRAAIRRTERVHDAEYRRFTRRELRSRMLGAVLSRQLRQVAPLLRAAASVRES